MKIQAILYLILTCFYTQAQDLSGFTIISDKNVYILDSENFSLSNGNAEDKSNEKNIFSFSFIDSVFIHTPINKDGMISQVYKITDVISNHETAGVDLYLIRVLSGLSGNYYSYFIEYNGIDLSFSQIYEVSDESEEELSCSGIRFEKLTHSVIRPFEQ